MTGKVNFQCARCGANMLPWGPMGSCRACGVLVPYFRCYNDCGGLLGYRYAVDGLCCDTCGRRTA